MSPTAAALKDAGLEYGPESRFIVISASAEIAMSAHRWFLRFTGEEPECHRLYHPLQILDIHASAVTAS